MNKTALVTGATSGLGLEFIPLLIQDGYNLILVARNEKKLNELANTYPGRVTTIAQDLSLPGASRLVKERVGERDIDVLINNAGFGLLGHFDELDLSRQTEMIELNITALTELTYFFLPSLKRRKGKIMNVASTAAFQPGPLMAVYYATKAYVLSFSEALAEELTGSGVSVTTLCPGATKTNFAAVAAVENTRMFSRAMDARTVATIGYKRMMRGHRVVITGGFNRFGALAAKFLPRALTAKVARSVAKEV